MVLEKIMKQTRYMIPVGAEFIQCTNLRDAKRTARERCWSVVKIYAFQGDTKIATYMFDWRTNKNGHWRKMWRKW